MNLKPIKWAKTGIACVDEQSYQNFEWVILEFTRWKTMVGDRLDYFDEMTTKKNPD